MDFISSIIILICIGTGGLLGWRGYREYLVNQVEKQTDLDALEKRKLTFFKQKMRQEHPVVLLVVNSFLVLSLLFVTLLHYSSQTRVNSLSQENQQLAEAVASIKEEQTALLDMPIFVYPSQGISFETIDWEQLLVRNDREERFAVEQELSSWVSPFLGRTMVLLFIDQPMQEITLTFTSRLADTKDFALWEENWDRLLEDLSQADLITQGIFSVQFSEEPEKSFEQTVIREDKEQWSAQERRFLSLETKESLEENEHKLKDSSNLSEQTEASAQEPEKEIEQKGRVETHE